MLYFIACCSFAVIFSLRATMLINLNLNRNLIDWQFSGTCRSTFYIDRTRALADMTKYKLRPIKTTLKSTTVIHVRNVKYLGSGSYDGGRRHFGTKLKSKQQEPFRVKILGVQTDRRMNGVQRHSAGKVA